MQKKKKKSYAKIFGPRKDPFKNIFDPRKNYDPIKKHFDQRNPLNSRKKSTHEIHAAT